MFCFKPSQQNYPGIPHGPASRTDGMFVIFPGTEWYLLRNDRPETNLSIFDIRSGPSPLLPPALIGAELGGVVW